MPQKNFERELLSQDQPENIARRDTILGEKAVRMAAKRLRRWPASITTTFRRARATCSTAAMPA
jgi:hypothetical protein